MKRSSLCSSFVIAALLHALYGCTQTPSHGDQSAEPPAAEPAAADRSGSPQPTAPAAPAPAVPAPAAPAPSAEPAAPSATPPVANAEPGVPEAKPAARDRQEPPSASAKKPAAEPAAEATKPAASTSTPAAAAAAGPCGDKGQPRCPLQAWMEDHLQHAVENDDLPGLAKELTHAATLAPDPSWNAGDTGWSTIAKGGAAAASAGDLASAKQSCKTCHKTWRAKYKETFRLRAIQ